MPYLTCLKALWAIMIGAYCCTASAELYKCKDSKGKTLYSESPCPAKYSGSEIRLEDNSMESAGIKRLQTQQATHNRATNTQPSNSSTQTDSRILMSDYDRNNRINENIVSSGSLVASREKKDDALNEQNALSQSMLYELSYENEIRRKNLKPDLNSGDRNKRRAALSNLRVLYLNYSD